LKRFGSEESKRKGEDGRQGAAFHQKKEILDRVPGWRERRGKTQGGTPIKGRGLWIDEGQEKLSLNAGPMRTLTGKKILRRSLTKKGGGGGPRKEHPNQETGVLGPCSFEKKRENPGKGLLPTKTPGTKKKKPTVRRISRTQKGVGKSQLGSGRPGNDGGGRSLPAWAKPGKKFLA